MKAVILARERDSVLNKEQPKALVKLCGVPLLKRNLYDLRSIGLRDVVVLTGYRDWMVEKIIGDGKDLGLRIIYVGGEGDEADQRSVLRLEQIVDGDFLVIQDGYLIDSRILESLSRIEGVVLCYDSDVSGLNTPEMHVEKAQLKENYIGVSRCTHSIFSLLDDQALRGKNWHVCLNEIAQRMEVTYLDISQLPRYISDIRREVKPYWFKIEGREDLKRCKRALVDMSQKRTLDVLAWYFHRPVENKIVYYVSELPITPNQLSILTNLVAYVVTFLFFTGHLLAGSFLTFVVNIMDGVDGKQARVKGITTKLGHIEHSFDLLFEQSWYIAFSWAIFSQIGDLLPLKLCILMILFDSFARHSSMQFQQVMGIPLADYAKFDRAFRRFDGRRNIYSIYILLGVLLGAPLYSLIAMTCHAILTGVVYVIRACQHLRSADKGGK